MFLEEKEPTAQQLMRAMRAGVLANKFTPGA